MTRKQSRRPATDRLAFTLIEVLLVLAILVVLGSIAASQFFRAADDADIDAAKAQIGMFSSSIDMYKYNCKGWPDKLEDLVSKPSDNTASEKWRGPYLTKSSIPTDPWGNEYKYSSSGKKNPESYDVWSTGPDGQDGTDDDIGNWDT